VGGVGGGGVVHRVREVHIPVTRVDCIAVPLHSANEFFACVTQQGQVQPTDLMGAL
jgi:hypothetical protein